VQLRSQLESRKERAATFSVLYNLAATAIKLVAAGLTGSIALFSEAAHSATDIVTSLMAWIGVRAAAAPPDDDHNYGHGKIESVVGFGEAILLLLIVIYVAVEACLRWFKPAEVSHLDFGIAVMAASAVSSFAVGRYVWNIGKQTESSALKSNGQHLLVDCWTSVAVLVGLALQKFTAFRQADSVVAILFCAWLGVNAAKMLNAAFHELIDSRVADDEVQQIRDILSADPEILSYHALRTRHSGSQHYIEAHIVVPGDWTVQRAHDIADRLEDQIEKTLHPATALIHVDPPEEEPEPI
jgi:cation diffusion facilitator family transporter